MENKLRAKPNENSTVIYGKLPPQAVDIEKSILGAIMVEKRCMDEVLDLIKNPQYFYNDVNKKIYTAIIEMNNLGRGIDFISICEYLKSKNELELVGGYFYVTNLTKSVTSTANLDEYCRIITEKFIKRELIRLGGELISKGYDDTIDTFEMKEDAEKTFTNISIENSKDGFEHISKGFLDDLLLLDEIRNNKGSLTGVDTGFYGLNKITSGWQKTDLIILAARPAVGKTAFALNLALAATSSKVNPVGVAFFSLEMSKKQLRYRIISNMSNVGLANITNGELSDQQMLQLQQANDKLSNYNLFIDDRSGLTIRDLKSRLRKLCRKQKIGLVIIDYLQLMKGDIQLKNVNREQELSKISRELKELAKELEIPIIALAQLNRDIEKRTKDKAEPQLSDLRESGAIEQDADIVTFLYRCENYVKFKIAKFRNGKIGQTMYHPILDFQRFKEYQEYEPVIISSGYNPYEDKKLIPMQEAIKKSEEQLLRIEQNVAKLDEDEELPF